MEKVTTIPFYRRFSLRVFLFNAIFLFSIIVPTLTIRKMDYKDLMDRSYFQTNFFYYCIDQLSRQNQSDWPKAIEAFPKLFYRQRICIFNLDKELMYDSGVMMEYDQEYRFDLLLPDPYIDWKDQNEHFDTGVYIDYLQNLSLENVDPHRVFRATRTVRYDEGVDRIILLGKIIRSADGEDLVFTMSQSVVDILIQGRSIKERLLFLYSLVILLCLLLTIILSWSVTSPLKKLYTYSREILVSKWKGNNYPELPKRGEIGEICQALQNLIEEQKRQSENFKSFSSDIVHELKTPLAAVRSGLEVYSESTDEGEKEEIYDRINRRIQQMESLMNEIRLMGSIEANTAEEYCRNVVTVSEEAIYEFKEAEIDLEVAPGIEAFYLPISCEKVYQILINLLKNAVSFSPDRGSVSVSLCIEDRFLIIQVGDKGPGIPEEVFSQITNRFFTFRPKNDEKHSGLGLSIIEAILRGCGGYLEYQNRIEGGAEFICRIPTYSKLRTAKIETGAGRRKA
jgi:signal transduction histidine kinase